MTVNTALIPAKARLVIYLVALAAWVIVMSATSYFEALEQTPPDVVVGARGVVNWIIGAGLLTAATHTGRQPVVDRIEAPEVAAAALVDQDVHAYEPGRENA